MKQHIWLSQDIKDVTEKSKELFMSNMLDIFIRRGQIKLGKKYVIEMESDMASLESDRGNIYEFVRYHATLEEFVEKELEDKECYETCKKAIDCYGDAKQASVAIEEMAELTVEILHSFRGREANVPEEIADVEIMLQQLKMIYNCSKEVEEIKDEKLFRLQERIEYEERQST